jgi:hypothetical protein
LPRIPEWVNVRLQLPQWARHSFSTGKITRESGNGKTIWHRDAQRIRAYHCFVRVDLLGWPRQILMILKNAEEKYEN